MFVQTPRRFFPALVTGSRLLLLAVLLGGLVTGCTRSKEERDAKSGALELAQRGTQSMESGNFPNAIRYFEGLEARFPFSNETRQAQLNLIYCYYKDGQIEATVDAATNFERENPTHPRVDYALYMRGLAYFSGESSWYHRWFNADLSDRPPKNLEESFSVFSQLLQRFPRSIYAEDARQRMIFLRNHLADYEMHVADYYMLRGAWLAAVNRAQYMLAQYGGAPATSAALRVMVLAYEQLGMTVLANDSRQVRAANFPQDLPKLAKQEAPPWYKFW